MILVTGSIVARADSFERLLALSLEHVRRSRTEQGCLAHAVHRDVENPLRLVFLEQWSDRGALAAHFAVAGSRAFVAGVRELAAEPPQIGVYEAEPVKV